MRNNILQVLRYFGPLNAQEIVDKLKLRGQLVKTWEVEQSLNTMRRLRDIFLAKGFKETTYKIRSY